MGKGKNNAAWAEAKKRCRLNELEIKMAKELGMKPKSLLKNIPSPQEKWKAPVKVWIRDLYEEKFGRLPAKLKTPNQNSGEKKKAPKSLSEIFDEELPF